jgi:hypothetical protein
MDIKTEILKREASESFEGKRDALSQDASTDSPNDAITGILVRNPAYGSDLGIHIGIFKETMFVLPFRNNNLA